MLSFEEKNPKNDIYQICMWQWKQCPTLSLAQARDKCRYKFPRLCHISELDECTFFYHKLWTIYYLSPAHSQCCLQIIAHQQNNTLIVLVYSDIVLVYSGIPMTSIHSNYYAWGNKQNDYLHWHFNHAHKYSSYLKFHHNSLIFFLLQLLIFIVAINLLSIFSLSGIFIY